MKDCLECGKKFDDSKRTSPWWKRQFERMGAMADICDECWNEEYNTNVKNR